MVSEIIFINSFISLIFIVRCVSAFRKGETLLPIFSLMYVATNGLFIFTNQLASSVYGYSISDHALELACIANFIFMIIVLVVAKVLPGSRRIGGGGRFIYPAGATFVVLAIFIIIIESRYLFLGGGIERALEVKNVTGRDSLYSIRYDESLAIKQGSGLFMAMIAQKVLLPLCALGLLFKIIVQKRKIYLYAFIPLILVGLTTAISTLQRSPTFNLLLVILLSILWCFYCKSFIDHGKYPKIKGSHLALIGMIFIFGASIYAFTEEASLLVGAYGLLERVFLISSFSSTSYYNLFGSGLPFEYLGVDYILGLPSEDSLYKVTYRDVGAAANGWPHNLNSSFLSTAYAALGFYGVIIISLIFVVSLRILDLEIGKMSQLDRYAICIANIFVVFEVCNGPLANGLTAGLFLNVLLYGMFFRWRYRI